MEDKASIFRLKLDASEIFDEALDNTDPSLWTRKDTTFVDMAMGGGQIVEKIERKLREHGHSDENIAKRVFGAEKEELTVKYAVNKRKLVGQYKIDKSENCDTFKGMKFDLQISNPPYNGNMDLKFVKLMMDRCKEGGEVVVVHPAISTISRKQTKEYVDHKKLIDGHVKSIKLFNGNPVFNIGLFYPCQIVHITPNQTHKSFPVEYDLGDGEQTYTFKSIFDVNRWGNIPEYYSLEKKILEYCSRAGNCEDKLGGKEGSYKKRKVTGKYYVNLAAVRGNVSDKMFDSDFYTVVTRDLKVEKFPTKNMWFSLNTAIEATNVLNYIKTNFARFCVSLLKSNVHQNRGELSSVPYFPSYKQEWTKARITKELSITKKEWAFIEKVIPPYYD